MRTLQAFMLMLGALCLALVLATVWALTERRTAAQWHAPGSEPPITWDASTDTLTITRKDVLVCIPQEGQTLPACRFAKWWTETVIR